MTKNLAGIKEGVLLVDKPAGKTSFSLVTQLRRLTRIEKIGHAGTLDPFATGLMVMLLGKFTKLSNQYMAEEKEYSCTILLGHETDTYDCDGKVVAVSDVVPTHEEIKVALSAFQGTLLQTPPMFSAKKVKGKKLYELARQGKEIERAPVSVTLTTTLMSYTYPFVSLNVVCSKGTYIRSLAHDLGVVLKCGAHLSSLRRLRCGTFHVSESLSGALLYDR